MILLIMILLTLWLEVIKDKYFNFTVGEVVKTKHTETSLGAILRVSNAIKPV